MDFFDSTMASEASTAGSPSFIDVNGDMKDSPAQSPASTAPTNSATPVANGNGGNSSRRPPRKSTLTQQQKNQKRQRATQDQLGTLEVEFNKNPTPTAVVRERIAQEINMTERSVQIWFQNRRAKIKNLAKKSIESGEECDAIPESMRKYLAMQALESGKPLVRDLTNPALAPFANGLIMNADSQAKVLISHLQCRTLSIGTWRRISQTALDLVVFYSPIKTMFTYYINADSCGFKIEFPFSSIKNITLDAGDAATAAEGAAPRSGGLIIELTAPPSFSMEPGSGGFVTCRDFTEDQQASKVLVHHLGGHSKILSGQLAKLVSLDSFRNRHSLAEPFVTNSVSAPVSPAIARPASQPNHLLHPHVTFPQQDLTQAMGPPGPRVGHKRQRSRSVPAAVDISQFRRPMPPFVQYDMPPSMHQSMPGPQHQHNNAHQHIFAPIPQHSLQMNSHMQQQMGQKGQPALAPQSLQPPTTFAPVGSNLSINTTAAGYDYEFRSGPMSATTAASSELDQGFFSGGPSSDTFSTPNINTPYTGTFYSPMVNPSSLSNPPFSPYSGVSANDPVIANQSPPLPTFDRSASAGIFSGVEDNAGFPDDSFSFNDLYSKQQPFALPFRSPVMENAQPDFDFQHMVSFDGDASSVSPDTSRVSATT